MDLLASVAPAFDERALQTEDQHFIIHSMTHQGLASDEDENEERQRGLLAKDESRGIESMDSRKNDMAATLEGSREAFWVDSYYGGFTNTAPRFAKCPRPAPDLEALAGSTDTQPGAPSHGMHAVRPPHALKARALIDPDGTCILHLTPGAENQVLGSPCATGPSGTVGHQFTSCQSDLASGLHDAEKRAILSNGGSTIGLSLFGCVIDYMVPSFCSTAAADTRRHTHTHTRTHPFACTQVPGGPAHLSNRLDKGDEVVEVDGQPVDASNVVGLLVGSDLAGSKVQIRVRKHDSGKLRDVELIRVPMSWLATVVALFKKLTLLKQNGYNNRGFEMTSYPPGQATTLSLVDEIVALVSLIQIENHNHGIETKHEFNRLYQDMRSRLCEAYDMIEDLKKQLTEARTSGVVNRHDRHAMGDADLAQSQLEEVQTLRRRVSDIECGLSADLADTQALLSDAHKQLGHTQGAFLFSREDKRVVWVGEEGAYADIFSIQNVILRACERNVMHRCTQTISCMVR
jgi:hypothetical protein